MLCGYESDQAGDRRRRQWQPVYGDRHEGLAIPAQVNYVGKGANLRALGFEMTGASSVVLKFLNTTYLWDKVRVQGGAYGGGSGLDPLPPRPSRR